MCRRGEGGAQENLEPGRMEKAGRRIAYVSVEGKVLFASRILQRRRRVGGIYASATCLARKIEKQMIKAGACADESTLCTAPCIETLLAVLTPTKHKTHLFT
jgi:hypothetical protein